MVRHFTLFSNLFNFLYLISLILCETWTSEVPRPRGVSLSRAPLYNPSKDFTCFDGSLKIPFTQVNDDYCDCPDASDEPGTSACPHGVFHCTNAGHKALNIASSRVNDGICDCCDASDEYANENSKCGNNCNELGKTAREEAHRMAELLKIGKQLRNDMSEKGIQMKHEMKEKLIEIQKQISEAEKVQLEKEMIKKQAEDLENAALRQYRELEEEERRIKAEAEAANNRAEATETFTKFDSNQDGKIDLSELQTRQTFDKDRNGEVSVEEAKFFLNEQESLELEEFIADAWSKIKPYLMMDAGLFKPPGLEAESEADDMQHEEEQDEHEQDIEDTEEHLEDDEEEEEHDQQEQPVVEKEEEQPASVQYDENTQRLIEEANSARNDFGVAEKAVKDIQAEIKRIEDYLEKDFGLDEEFASLQGQCFDYTDYEYVYKLCPFEKVNQQPKSGSIDTRLGTWSKWIGTDDNKYGTMYYDHGQSCWNGPPRSTTIKLSCGSENRITSVSEPNRCEYLFEFTTPAACRELQSEHSDDVHDEL